MSASTSKLSYSDCFEVMDKALEADRGVRIQFNDEGNAKHFLVRCHKARVLDRHENRLTYNEGDPLYARSIYDPLMGQIKRMDGKIWLFLRKLSAEHLVIEEIDGTELVDTPAQIEIRVTPLLPDPMKMRRL